MGGIHASETVTTKKTEKYKGEETIINTRAPGRFRGQEKRGGRIALRTEKEEYDGNGGGEGTKWFGFIRKEKFRTKVRE